MTASTNAGAPLTARQIEVLRLYVRGTAQKQMAFELGVQLGTVKAFMCQIRNRGLKSRAQLIAYANCLDSKEPE